MTHLANWIATVIFIVAILIIINRLKHDEEAYYPIKILGYSILGSFRFIFNNVHIPIGFIIFLLAFHSPQKNQLGKRCAACLGLVGFIVSLAIPSVYEAYFERTRYVEPVSTSVYEFDFKEHWRQVAEILKLDEHSYNSTKIENLIFDYKRDGEIENLRYQLIWRQNEQFYHASVNYHEGQKTISIRASKISQWLQYDRLTCAERLFEMLSGIIFKELTPTGNSLNYSFNFFGEYSGFGIQNGEKYVIEQNKIVPFTGKLPISCYWIKVFERQEGGEQSGKLTNDRYYLFDISQ